MPTRIPSARELFEAHLSLIQELIRYICHSHRLPREDAEEFSSYAFLKLIEDDYAVFRSFQGRSSLRTYLTIVVHRLFLDFRVQRWGKWRPTAEARRLGGAAIELDRLLSRDGQTLENAVEILYARSGGSLTREELLALASRLPQRTRPRFESLEKLDWVSTDVEAEESLQNQEREATSKRIGAALAKALEEISAEDRLLLKMRYEDGFTVREIAAALHLEDRPLYSRFEKCLRRLRMLLEESGITWNEVVSILGWTGTDIDPLLGPREEATPPGPSNRSDEAHFRQQI
jgi:RNA polymerase sigma factor (sigma-70 family)